MQVGKIVLWLAIIFLAAVFIAAGTIKIHDPRSMFNAIQSFQCVTPFLAVVGAYFFPCLELLAGVGLLWRRTRVASAFIIAKLMIVFMLVIILAWVRGIKINCGCFGGYDPLVVDDYRLLLLRDAGLFVLATVIFGWQVRRNHEK